MSERDLDEERRLRRAATMRYGVVPEDEAPERDEARSAEQPDEDDNAASRRMEQKTLWVEMQVRSAIERGDFADLPGAGKPLHLPPQHDPDWWVKRLIEREKITGVAPAAITLRHEDAELDSALDREWAEDGVRRVVTDFNRRVVEARRQLTGGPPVVTRLRDPDVEVARWRQRREESRRRAAEDVRASREREAARAEAARAERRQRWRRLLGRRSGPA